MKHILACIVLSSIAFAFDDQTTDDEDLYEYDDIDESSGGGSGDFGIQSNIPTLVKDNSRSIDLNESPSTTPAPTTSTVEPEPIISSKFKLLVSLILGISCLTCLTLIILFSLHRYKKKDEGSYEIAGGYYTPGKASY